MKMISKTKNTPKFYSDNSYEDGEVKQMIRTQKLKAFNKSPYKKGKIMSLPFSQFKFELLVREQISDKFDFKCFETNPDTKRQASKFIQQNKLGKKVTLLEMPIEVGIKNAEKDEYVGCDFDYMGQHWFYAAELEMAIKKKIVKIDAPICITLSERIHKKGVKFTEDIIKKHPMTAKDKRDFLNLSSLEDKMISSPITKSEHAFYMWLKNVIGRNYVIEEFTQYSDSVYDGNGKVVKRQQKMMLATIRRVK